MNVVRKWTGQQTLTWVVMHKISHRPPNARPQFVEQFIPEHRTTLDGDLLGALRSLVWVRGSSSSCCATMHATRFNGRLLADWKADFIANRGSSLKSAASKGRKRPSKRKSTSTTACTFKSLLQNVHPGRSIISLGEIFASQRCMIFSQQSQLSQRKPPEQLWAENLHQ